MIKEPGAARPLAAGVKSIVIVAVPCGCNGPKGCPVTMYGAVVTDGQLPLRIPRPTLVTFSVAVACCPSVLPTIVTAAGIDALPAKAAPLTDTVWERCAGSLLVIIAFAVLVVPFGVKLTVTLAVFRGAMLKGVPAVMPKTDDGGLTEDGSIATLPIRFPVRLEFLITKLRVAEAPVPMPTAGKTSALGATIFAPSGVAIAVGVLVGVPPVAVAVAVGVPEAVAVAVAVAVEGVVNWNAPRPCVPAKIVPLVFCSRS